MARSARPDDQLRLPPMELRDSEQVPAAFRNSEQPDQVFGKSEQNAAALLNVAFAQAGLENKDIAHLCGVSVSLVEKWRAADSRGCPSFAQLLMLPPAFHIELHRVMNKRFGFGRAALQRLTDAMADLALVVEA